MCGSRCDEAVLACCTVDCTLSTVRFSSASADFDLRFFSSVSVLSMKFSAVYISSLAVSVVYLLKRIRLRLSTLLTFRRTRGSARSNVSLSPQLVVMAVLMAVPLTERLSRRPTRSRISCAVVISHHISHLQ